MTRSHPSLRARCRRAPSLLALAALLAGPAAIAAAPDGLTADDLAALKWREVGSAAPSGRIARFAVHPDDTRVIYAASASGGLWKTVNAGTTWMPVFTEQATVSMGDVALTPGNPDVVWVGTGEQNSVRSSQFGNGVYRSRDGGKTWVHLGLDKSERIHRICLHPTDPEVAARLVKTEGPA